MMTPIPSSVVNVDKARMGKTFPMEPAGWFGDKDDSLCSCFILQQAFHIKLSIIFRSLQWVCIYFNHGKTEKMTDFNECAVCETTYPCGLSIGN